MEKVKCRHFEGVREDCQGAARNITPECKGATRGVNLGCVVGYTAFILIFNTFLEGGAPLIPLFSLMVYLGNTY